MSGDSTTSLGTITKKNPRFSKTMYHDVISYFDTFPTTTTVPLVRSRYSAKEPNVIYNTASWSTAAEIELHKFVHDIRETFSYFTQVMVILSILLKSCAPEIFTEKGGWVRSSNYLFMKSTKTISKPYASNLCKVLHKT